MNPIQTLLAAVKHAPVAHPGKPQSEASLWARYRFRQSMLGESAVHEAARLYGVGR